MIVCAVHGIFVYVALMSGLFIAEGNLSFDGAAPDQMQARYFRMAATASIFSIAAGTSPNFIRDLAGLFQIDRLRRKP
jgi:hypothetical protein